MTKIFEQLKEPNNEQPIASNTAEEHLFTIINPVKSKEIQVSHTIQDSLEEEGYTKRIKATILECSCCGALCSFSPDTRYKPPAGRCQNPDCRGLICNIHIEKQFSCNVCGKQLCMACLRKTKSEQVYCQSCFQKYAQEHHLHPTLTVALP